MRILMFGWEFPPHISGGLGTACYGLSKGLAKHNVEMIFVVPKAHGDEDKSHLSLVDASGVRINKKCVSLKELKDHLTWLEVDSGIVPYTSEEQYKNNIKEKEQSQFSIEDSVFSPSFKFSGKYGSDLLLEVARYALVAGEIATSNQFDIIHAHDWLTYEAGIAAKRVSGKPLVIHVHATEFDRSGQQINQKVYDIEKKGMEAADKIITVSELTRKIVIEKYGISPDKITTVYNGIDPIAIQKYKRTLKEKVVTFLGRVTYQKGPEYFVEAAYKVLQKTENVRFVMAGSGDLMEKMVRRAAELGITHKFHFTGFLKGQDVYKMFGLSDVYVMPSVSEPFGISPLEAIQSGVPVIISKQSGVSEVLKNAIKIDFWDVDAMADAIYGLVHYHTMSKQFSKNGVSEVLGMGWTDAAGNVKKVYESSLQQN